MGIVARWSWVKEEVDFRVNRMCCYQFFGFFFFYQFYFLAGSGIGGGWVVTGLAAVFLRLAGQEARQESGKLRISV